MALQGYLLTFLVLLAANAGLYFFAITFFPKGQTAVRITIFSSLMTLLGVLGFRWNQLAGMLVFPLLGTIFFLASVALISQSLFPVYTWQDRRHAFKVLLSFIFDSHLPSYVIEHKKASKRISGHNGSRYGAGVVLVDIGNAAVMQTASEFSRVIGPGVNYSQRSENVKAVVDLHTQLRSAKVQALTKDGVPLTTVVSCLFRIATEGTTRGGTDTFTYSKRTIRRVIYKQEGVFKPEGEDEEDEPYYWEDLALQVVSSRFREIMARFRLDQLFEIDNPDHVPRLVLKSSLHAAAVNDLRKRDIELIAVNFDLLEFSGVAKEQVTKQRIKSWQTEWQALSASRLARGAAEAERQVKKARAAAEWELIQGLINGLATAQGLSGIDPADLVSWQLLSAMESMSDDPMLQPVMPKETVTALLNIRDWLEGGKKP